MHWQWQLAGPRAPLAMAVPGVVGELGAEGVERAGHKTRGPVWMSTRAATTHERGQTLDALCGVPLSETARDLLHRGGDRVEAVHARSALAGALFRHPACHARGLRDRTGVLGEQQHHACAERGAVGREMFVRERDAAQELTADPAASVTT